MKIGRRTLIKGGAVATAALLPLPFVFRERNSSKLPDGLIRDPAGVLDLAPGLSYRVLSKQFSPMDDGYRVPALPDGMACFAGPRNTLILMRNHEILVPAMLGPYHRGQTPPREAYDPRAFGGVTRVVVDAQTLQVVSSNLVLAGTARNCSGGPSPWGWLTCEESVEEGHGYVFLCRTQHERVAPPHKIAGYGRFNHEAVCVHPDSHVAYLTEDRVDGCLYRFVPQAKERPFEGRLQALRLIDHPRLDTGSDFDPSRSYRVDWVDIERPDSPEDDVREQAQARGAAIIRRGEGIAYDRGDVYVCATSGGPANAGQIFRLCPATADAPERLELVVASTDPNQLDMPDNLTVAPWGDLVVAEDGGSPHKFIRGITPQGRVYDIARNAHSSGELAGVCFSPDGKTLFFNMQRDGLTVAVTGAFAQLASSKPS